MMIELLGIDSSGAVVLNVGFGRIVRCEKGYSVAKTMTHPFDPFALWDPDLFFDLLPDGTIYMGVPLTEAFEVYRISFRSAEPTEGAEPTEEPSRPACRVYTFKFDSNGIKDPDPHFDYDTKEIHTVDESKVGQERTVELLGKQYRLTYMETIDSIINDVLCDKYSVNGSEEDYALLLPDDSVYYFCMRSDNCLSSIEADESMDEAAVCALVEDAFKNEFDFSRFGSKDVMRTGHRTDGSGFGKFYFGWYNEKGNYKTMDRLEIHVSSEGKITDIRAFFRAFSEISAPDNVAAEDYSAEISEKLGQYYGKDYIGHEIQHARWTRVEGRDGLLVQVGVELTDHDVYAELFIEILP